MSTITTLNFEVPATPSSWTVPLARDLYHGSTPRPRTLLPVGSAYLAHARRTIHKRTLQEDFDELREQQRQLDENRANGAFNEEDDLGVGDEEETPELLGRDAKEWKGQDHYAVLGLSKFRYKATQEQIKIAHRKKVLKHHPDKKAGGGDSNNDQFFKCIQKAMEILSNPEKRRQFDSVDPYFASLEDEIDASDLAKHGFFAAFGPVFERHARFSKRSPVPLLGTISDTKAEVEEFYDFWYNFDSWRSFEYHDKEVNEGSDRYLPICLRGHWHFRMTVHVHSRDDKRFTEKKNKSERARRKKEDNTRLRSLVDLALSVDPRIKRIKQEEKEERERKKNKAKPNAKLAAANAAKKARRAEKNAAAS
ncbi:hypothetical protein BS47DRAFT_1344064 [Hydnum rufescens UP504]|uniref:J domain-containing protein n=1 Tax=Hydnum rufescens UP504 TaxID=1448309 RepID=A0A9P6AZE7_9AGAM|nr:hypothetical protein BS47DRAFT_1344064 [Hydnum rufescens UP504]